MARTKLSPPPVRTPFVGAYGTRVGVKTAQEQLGAKSQPGEQQTPSWAWVRWFQEAHTNVTHPALPLPPATSSAAADGGEITFDANFVYVATGKNQWKRAALVSF